MTFAFGQQIERLRPPMVDDRYSGKETVGDWANAQAETIPDSWVDRSSARRSVDLSRTQFADMLSLYVEIGGGMYDLKTTDRIRVGGEAGRVYEIEGIPTPEVNPFTGWVPPLEVPLGRAVG